MTRHATRLLLLVSLGAVVLAAPIVARQPPPAVPPTGFADPVLGRWDLTVEGADGKPFPSWLHVHLRKESQLQGRFVGQFGSVRNLTRAEYWDGTLLFEVPVQYEQNKSDLRFEGKLTGDRLEGTTTDAKGATLKWTGRRAPEHGPSRQVTFGQPIELFNGRDLTGWKPRSAEHPGCWQVADGALTAAAKCVDLISERTFRDARLHVEFKYPPKGNAGVYLRGRYEVQIQDDRGKALDALRMGGVYGFVRPYVDAAGAPDEWQTYDITLVGSRVTLVLNGKTIADHEVIPGITGGALDSNEGEPGPLMLQGDHGKIAFRTITLAEGK